jgi:hypothetical protein
VSECKEFSPCDLLVHNYYGAWQAALTKMHGLAADKAEAWTPDACVKTCTARFLTLPASTLEKSLDTGAYKFNIEGIQKQGVTPSEVDIFLKGKEGKLFLESVGKTDAKTLRMLAYESTKTSINKGE